MAIKFNVENGVDAFVRSSVSMNKDWQEIRVKWSSYPNKGASNEIQQRTITAPTHIDKAEDCLDGDACILSIRSAEAAEILSRDDKSSHVQRAEPTKIPNYYVDDPNEWIMHKSFI
jgi:hypothetical protein